MVKEKIFERKAEVIESALDEFISKDYEKASLNAIIKNAGISKGTFYYHFKNKEALYLFLLKTGTDAKWQYIGGQTSVHNEEFKPKDIFDKFLYQAQIGAGFVEKYPKWYRLGQMFAKEKNNPIYATALDYLSSDRTNIIEVMVKEAIQKKELDSTFDEDFIVKLLSHMLIEFDQVFDERSDYNKDQILRNLESYVRFMKYGLKRKE